MKPKNVADLADKHAVWKNVWLDFVKSKSDIQQANQEMKETK